MKAKIFTCVIVAGGILGAVAFGQSVKIQGTVSSVNDNEVDVQCDGVTWAIKRTSSTTITPSPAPGVTVAVQSKCTDAQRKEGPTGTPSATPTQTPKPGFQITGTVVAFDSSQITLQCDTVCWSINRTSSTSISPSPKPGATVTVQSRCVDAQRKECPAASATPTATPNPSRG